MTFANLASTLKIALPSIPVERKGWVGMALEMFLGANAGSQALPDFTELGIEMKTLPLTAHGKVAESTFVTNIPLLSIHRETWDSSTCRKKLSQVLWVPIEGDRNTGFGARRIGPAFLWSPDADVDAMLAADWQELVNLISLGKLQEITATMGRYLQIRPKAANCLSLCDAYDATGLKSRVLPRGFYLRASFTNTILKDYLS